MDILIDALGITNRTTGVGRYSHQLLKELLDIDKENQYKILIQKSIVNNKKVDVFKEKNNAELVPVDIDAIGLMRQYKYIRINRDIKFDLFHCLNSNYPLFVKNGIVTIHDLKYIKYPHYLGKFNFLKKKYLYYVFSNAIKNSKKIIAVSNSTKKDILELFEVENPDKIKVIYEASNIKKSKKKESDLEEYGVKKPYFLFLGEHRPHKNIKGLIKAFDIFINRYKNSDYNLVITGKKHASYREKITNISEETKNKIIFTGFVPDKILFDLYNNSYAFLLISLYEGFGIPILEAMQCSTPVITSNISSMPEIGGNAAITVDPYNYNEIAKKMNLIIEDKKLYRKLQEKGIKRVSKFTWKKTAKETLETYLEVYSQK